MKISYFCLKSSIVEKLAIFSRFLMLACKCEKVGLKFGQACMFIDVGL
jgi:hypothetical protein